MLRILALSSFLFTLAIGTASALEAESIEDIVLLRAFVDHDPEVTDPSPPPEVFQCTGFDSFTAADFFEVPHDDTLATTRFIVPEGSSLVVTSFQWQSFDGDDNPTHGNRMHTAAFEGHLPVPGTKDFIFVGRTVAPAGIADVDGGVGSSIVMPTGIVIPAGAHLCMQVGGSLGPYVGEAIGFLQGFLVKDKRRD